jgi:hypothetical protein
MHCAECVRLKVEREMRQVDYATAWSKLRAALTQGTDDERYTRLRAKAKDARAGLDQADVDFRYHQDKHAVPN